MRRGARARVSRRLRGNRSSVVVVIVIVGLVAEIVARLSACEHGRAVKDGGRAALLARCDGVGDGRAREELGHELVAHFAREMRLQHGEYLAIEAAVEDAARGVVVRQHVETACLELSRLRVGVAAAVALVAGERPREILGRGFVPFHHCDATWPLCGDGREQVSRRAEAVQRNRK